MPMIRCVTYFWPCDDVRKETMAELQVHELEVVTLDSTNIQEEEV